MESIAIEQRLQCQWWARFCRCHLIRSSNYHALSDSFKHCRNPLIARLPEPFDERGQLFQRAAEEHWPEAGQRAKDRGLGFVIGFGGGGGFGFDLRGRANGKMHFSYSDEGASVEETLRFIAGQEIEIWDRFGISDEGDGLLYKQIVKSGGRDLTREEVFPLQDTDGNTRIVR
ncbi:MAG: hypothetical protein ABSE96_13550 [Terracidiphilus sp.]